MTDLKKHIATLPNVVDKTAEHLGIGFTLIGAEGLCRTMLGTQSHRAAVGTGPHRAACGCAQQRGMLTAADIAELMDRQT